MNIFRKSTTIDAIIAPMKQIVARLEEYVAEQSKQAEKDRAKAAELNTEAESKEQEARVAADLAARYRHLTNDNFDAKPIAAE